MIAAVLFESICDFPEPSRASNNVSHIELVVSDGKHAYPHPPLYIKYNILNLY